jgi:(p)ppGpp synthase/HD superfamily hydrolase
MFNVDLIDKAIKVSAKAHHNQFRKGTDLPYISHPYAVGMLLMRHDASEEEIAAGILHDTVEDTSLTLKDIEDQFGEKVARIVEGCSEPNKDLSWEERKEHTIEYLKTAPFDIRQVTCADKLHNVSSMRKNEQLEPDTFWNRFKRGKDKQAWYYKSVVDSLGEQGSFSLLDELKEEVEKLFG